MVCVLSDVNSKVLMHSDLDDTDSFHTSLSDLEFIKKDIQGNFRIILLCLQIT